MVIFFRNSARKSQMTDTQHSKLIAFFISLNWDHASKLKCRFLKIPGDDVLQFCKSVFYSLDTTMHYAYVSLNFVRFLRSICIMSLEDSKNDSQKCIENTEGIVRFISDYVLLSFFVLVYDIYEMHCRIYYRNSFLYICICSFVDAS
jgi:hypothetical protein